MELTPLSLEGTPLGNMYTKEIDGLCDAIIENTEVPVSIESAIFDQKIVEAAYKSTEENCFIELV